MKAKIKIIDYIGSGFNILFSIDGLKWFVQTDTPMNKAELDKYLARYHSDGAIVMETINGWTGEIINEGI